MKRKLSYLLIIAIIITQLIVLNPNTIKAQENSAQENKFSCQVVVLSNQGKLISDISDKENAFEALNSVMTKNNYGLTAFDSEYGKFISGIKNLTTGMEINGTSSTYWMYTVNRNGNYIDINTSISNFKLLNDDKLIFYYADFGTVLANRISYSTNIPNKPLTITLNSFDSWSNLTNPINNINVKIDGNTILLKDNKIELEQGLAQGKHTLEISDFKEIGIPKVVADTFDFYMDGNQAYIRIEGLNGTIAEGNVKGNNVIQAVEKLLNTSNIQYKNPSGSYITEINGIKASQYGLMSGWMYYVKSNGMVISPQVGMNDYIHNQNDEIVLYYGDFGATPYVNNIKFTPEKVEIDKLFKIRFCYYHFDFSENKNVDSPIIGAIVNIDNTNYITDNNGEINVEGLSLGKHTYTISGYNINKLSTVIMDKGIINLIKDMQPIMLFSDLFYNELNNIDNTKIVKNIEDTIPKTAEYIKDTNNPWAVLTLKKLGISAQSDYIKQCEDNIKQYGISSFTNTELEKLIICLASAGYSPYDFIGNDIVAELFNRDINNFLVNDCIFALIALDYTNVEDNKYKITSKVLIDTLISNISETTKDSYVIKGWSYDGKSVDPDMTGVAINALSSYYMSDEKIKNILDSVVLSLSKMQNESGYITGAFGASSETQAFVVLGLTSIGVNPEGILFTKSKGDAVSALLSFKNEKGEFKHEINGDSNTFSSEQALRALISLKNYKNTGIYNFYKEKIDLSKLQNYPYKKDSQENNGDSNEDITPGGENSNGNNINNNENLTGNNNTQDNENTNGNSNASNNSNTNKGNSLDNGSNDEKNENTQPIKDNADVKPTDEIDTTKVISIDDPMLLLTIDKIKTGNKITVDIKQNSIIKSNIFDAIKGKDKTIVFKNGNITWTFNGMNITNPIDLDISMNIVPTNKVEIEDKYRKEDLFVISFKGSGVLPGKAEVRIKIDEKWLQGKNRNELFFYFYNEQNEKCEKIEGPLAVDFDGYVTIHLNHLSDYFISNNNNVTEYKEIPVYIYLISCFSVIVIIGIIILINKNKKVLTK